MRHSLFLFFALGLSVAAPASAADADVQAAVELLKQSHADQCQKTKLRGQLLLAHQQHDQDKLHALEPELDAINKRTKPVEDKLNALKATIKKNPQDQAAFEAAQIELGDCE